VIFSHITENECVKAAAKIPLVQDCAAMSTIAELLLSMFDDYTSGDMEVTVTRLTGEGGQRSH